MKRLTPFLIPLCLVALFSMLPFLYPSAFDAMRLRYFDSLQRLKPRVYEPLPVRIVDLDDATLEKYGQWPWPRTQVAELVDGLQKNGAAVVAFDILFSEPDRTSPQEMLPLWSRFLSAVPLAEVLQALPDHDQVLAETMAKGRTVTAFSVSTEPSDELPAHKSGFAHGGHDPRGFLPLFSGWVKSLEVLENAAAGNGAINFYPEHDASVRRLPLFLNLEGAPSPYPSLALEAVRLFAGAGTYKVKASGASGVISFGEKTGIIAAKIGPYRIPTGSQGRVWLYDTGPVEKRFIPAWHVLENTGRTHEVEDAIVFIGTSAMGLKDIRSTPLDPAAPGVLVHAQIAEQILSRNFLHRPDWSPGAEFLFFLLVSLLLIAAMPHLGAAWCATLAALSFVSIFSFSAYGFVRYRWLVDPLLPSISVLIIYTTSSLIHYLKTDREKREIRGAFSRYLAPSVVEKIANNPKLLELGGEMKPMSILFADIRGFTSLSENFEPKELTRFINSFLTPMTDVILRRQGTIDKYMGDCIMAFWNAPLDDPGHARHACIAALEMQRTIREKKHTLRLGIGINTGTCCVGNMGSDQRFDYSVLGDTVNLASRLEGLCRIYEVDIVVGEEVVKQVPDFSFLELDLVRVKGKSIPERVYGLLGDGELRKEQTFEPLQKKHRELLHAYRRQEWGRAARLAKECRAARVPGLNLEGFYDGYLKRIEDLKGHSPSPDWDGVTIAASK